MLLRLAMAFLLVCGSACAPRQDQATTRVLAPEPVRVVEPEVSQMAHWLAQQVNHRTGSALFDRFTPQMQAALSEVQTQQFCVNVAETKGEIRALRPLRLKGSRKGTYLFQAEQGDWHVELTLNGEGLIAGLSFTEPPGPPPEVESTQATMGLPVRGEWFVFWGGDRSSGNIHVDASADQRRAADLVKVDAEGRSHQGQGQTNEEYYAFGQDIVAAASGTVVVAIDGVPDNIPGRMNRASAVGNAVLIQQDTGEYALYAHLKKGSLPVEEGERVEAGQLLGQCGNSGNSSEPHLHFHVQDGPDIGDGMGLEASLTGVEVIRNGETSRPDQYSFLRGDRVRPAPGDHR
jgi:murein DD-endopeptidase MepM/ murein hydrolase activator NlpD